MPALWCALSLTSPTQRQSQRWNAGALAFNVTSRRNLGAIVHSW